MTGNVPQSQSTESSANPTIMVVSNDLKLLKLLDMALKLEMPCDVLAFASGKSAEETAKHMRPDLLILDEQLFDTYDLADRLHRILRLEIVPMLMINTATEKLGESQDYPLMRLRMGWKINELYEAVYQLLGCPA